MKDRILNFLRKQKKTHITKREIARALDISPEEKHEFRQAIATLFESGVLVRVKKNYYAIQGKSYIVRGKLQCHRGGFGFLIPEPESGLSSDVYISGANLGEAAHGDEVVVQLVQTSRPITKTAKTGQRNARPEGKVVRVLKRGKKLIVGKYFFFKKPIVIPLDARYHYTINVLEQGDFKLEDDDVVQVELISEPTPFMRPSGRIVSFIGKPDDPDLQFKIVIKKHNIPLDFPDEVLDEASNFPDRISQEELNGRADYRSLHTVTIDGDTAFDFDDAVHVERLENGNYLLGVHIADVSHYVTSGSPLDQEAFRRGTSVYFPDRAVPMLPLELSSNICSLLPNKDRLAFSAILLIDPHSGKRLDVKFTPSVIRSKGRLTYSQVAGALEGNDVHVQALKDHLTHLLTMKELFEILNERRHRRGAIDFDLPEEEVRFDEFKNVIGIYKAERTIAHRIIEEFMLIANEAVAEYFSKNKIEAIYRVHDEPDNLKVQEFADVASRFGYEFPMGKEHYSPRDFQKIADSFDESPIGHYLSYVMLRSFKLAAYSNKNVGHFGLALRNYTHFTSPIRRYPDLVVHRLLKLALKGHSSNYTHELPAPIEEVALQSSEREREAVEAEREILAWKKALFMETHLGDEFKGFVSGIRPNGFHVELGEFFIEGFVNLSTLRDDFYIFDEHKHLFRGERTGRVFQLGTPVVVRVDKIDMERFLIDFSIVDKKEKGKKYSNNFILSNASNKTLNRKKNKKRSRR